MIPEVPENEIEISCSRSSGPGGQNVNKTSTKVIATWNVSTSTAFTKEQKERIIARYNNEILQTRNQETRSQLENKKRAIRKLNSLVHSALKVDKNRIATKPTFSSRLRRLVSKKHRSQTKILRKKPNADD